MEEATAADWLEGSRADVNLSGFLSSGGSHGGGNATIDAVHTIAADATAVESNGEINRSSRQQKQPIRW